MKHHDCFLAITRSQKEESTKASTHDRLITMKAHCNSSCERADDNRMVLFKPADMSRQQENSQASASRWLSLGQALSQLQRKKPDDSRLYPARTGMRICKRYLCVHTLIKSLAFYLRLLPPSGSTPHTVQPQSGWYRSTHEVHERVLHVPSGEIKSWTALIGVSWWICVELKQMVSVDAWLSMWLGKRDERIMRLVFA